MLRVLNMYAGIGGNRKLWRDVKVVAVEIDREIAQVYSANFPEDEVIVGDAHQFLLENFRDFDFIWSSPPCQTHSRARYWRRKEEDPVYPDMRLWQEIIFLKHHAKGKWVVENVIPYYDVLVKPTVKIWKHYFWSNFHIPKKEVKLSYKELEDCVSCMEREYGIDVSLLKGKKKEKALRNAVHPDIGLHVFRSLHMQTDLKGVMR